MKTCCMILLAAFTSLASAQQNDVTSILEVLDVTNGRRTVVKEFPYRVEAPNWTPDGQWLVYNSGGKLYKLSPDSPGEPEMINTGFATRCNNDHVIAADGKQIAISHGTKEDGKSQHLYPPDARRDTSLDHPDCSQLPTRMEPGWTATCLLCRPERQL